MQANCFYYKRLYATHRIGHQLQRWGSAFGGWSWELTEQHLRCVLVALKAEVDSHLRKTFPPKQTTLRSFFSVWINSTKRKLHRFYPLRQGWPTSRGSWAACGSLPGFTRLLRKYRIYSCIGRKFCTSCSPWKSGCDLHTRCDWHCVLLVCDT